jgi:hypothetical protein
VCRPLGARGDFGEDARVPVRLALSWSQQLLKPWLVECKDAYRPVGVTEDTKLVASDTDHAVLGGVTALLEHREG